MSKVFNKAISRLMQRPPRSVPTWAYLRARVDGRSDVEHEFHTRLILRNGVTRMTQPHRMDDLLPPIVERAIRIDSRPLRLLDVGCSAGISTLELHDALAKAGLACSTYGTDLLLHATLVSRSDGNSLLFDKERQVLQIELGDWACSWLWQRRDSFFHPRLSFAARMLIRDAESFRAALERSRAGYRVTSVPLITSRAGACSDVTFAEENLMAPTLSGTFSIIRAANLLNLGYFQPEELRRMVQALCLRLEEGGLLVVARTDPPHGINHATLFRYKQQHLIPEYRLNGGSEIETLIAGFDA